MQVGSLHLLSLVIYPYLATYLTQIESDYVRNGTAIGILFVLTLIVGGIVNYVISQLVDKTGLTGTDRVLGAAFGLIRGGVNRCCDLILLGYLH